MATQPRPQLSPEEYLAIERQAEYKSEYWNGEMFAMSGASGKHCLVAANFLAAAKPRLRGRGCNVYTGDLRVYIPATGLFTYPDATIICGPPQYRDGEFDNLLNPSMILEVASPSTEKYDRTKKFDHYQTIPSLRAYLLLAQDEPRAELFWKADDGEWHFHKALRLEDKLTVPPLGIELPLAELYDGLEFEGATLR